ncbi:MAG: hypothetical protein JNL32_14180 [Candidatus Kapabacteria bacterium]|nr:hypothetical protein [Candidatus Kapabacteria bacterium]
MCKLQPLATSFNGSVFHCKECGEINIRYGTFRISMDVMRFRKFYDLIFDVHKDYVAKPITKKYCANITYHTDVHIVLQGSQVEELHTLLSRAIAYLGGNRSAEDIIAMQSKTWRNN